MMIWKESLGTGRALMAPRAKLRWRWTRWATIQQIGEKKGTKRSLLVDGTGVPLSLIVSGANRHDVKLLAETLDSIVIRRPKPTRRRRQNLCADKGYSGKPAAAIIRRRGYIPHVKQIGQETKPIRGRRQPARRWKVERTHSWLNRFRKLLVRYEKKADNFLGLLHCACALICWRMC
jgi:putative transposase